MKTITESIIDKVFRDGKESYSKKEAIAKVDHVLTLLTKTQKVNLLKKVERCEYYIDQLDKGLERRDVRSRLTRKGVLDQHMNDVCFPCEVLMSKRDRS